MSSFLYNVAQQLLTTFGTDLSKVTVVFPNKRASLFLNEHLARLCNRPIWSPSYTTISDLFRSLSPREVADPIKLICDLYKSFVSCTGINETLDHFYGWGEEDLMSSLFYFPHYIGSLGVKQLHSYFHKRLYVPEHIKKFKRFARACEIAGYDNVFSHFFSLSVYFDPFISERFFIPYLSITPGRSSMIFLHAYGSVRLAAPTSTAEELVKCYNYH